MSINVNMLRLVVRKRAIFFDLFPLRLSWETQQKSVLSVKYVILPREDEVRVNPCALR